MKAEASRTKSEEEQASDKYDLEVAQCCHVYGLVFGGSQSVTKFSNFLTLKLSRTSYERGSRQFGNKEAEGSERKGSLARMRLIAT